MSGTILVIGLGALGTSILEQLVNRSGIEEIVAADIDDARGRQIVSGLIYGVSNFGLFPNIHFAKVDLFDTEETVEFLKTVKPRLICNTTTLASWWFPHLLPVEIARKVLEEAGLGPWTPAHLALTYRLMQAIKKADVETDVVNASYNDAVSPILTKAGLVPKTGLVGRGNIQLLVPRIRMLVSERLKVRARNIMFSQQKMAKTVTSPFGVLCSEHSGQIE